MLATRFDGIAASVGRAGGEFVVSLQGAPARRYQLLRSLNLAPPWTPVATAGPFASAQSVVLSDPDPPANWAFYRIGADVAEDP